SAVATVKRFSTAEFTSRIAATIGDLQYHGETSLVMQMFERLFASSLPDIPADSTLLLATTKGEIDLLEKSLLGKGGDPVDSRLDRLLAKVAALSGAKGPAAVISAACTSSSAAVGRAAAMIRSGKTECVLVAACDSVTEFIYSGFSSLMALDTAPARPFDAARKGLSLGEAVAFSLLMSEERANREGRKVLCEIAGWGMGDDANHMTGPSRQSEGLISAIQRALSSAGVVPEDIDFISAHGTGTNYNDEMEMRAFRALFSDTIPPVYSVKGAIGHTMGAAGLIETIIAMKSLQAATVPPTVNFLLPDDASRGWVSAEPVPLERAERALVTNSGFSGVNTALILNLPSVKA
ncbi:MAG TPA: beta-ketoacyl synthase N-terminal-like domain-containing protein, partial [Geobacteraceae bacterium]|nr:beta-ketoacyl synthase N-terminal-like domain-containing protein [Geobacteraceae bacterium]